MADRFKLLYQGQLTTTPAVLYTVPAGRHCIIKHISVTNPTGGAVSFRLWQGGLTDADLIVPAASIVAGGWADFDGAITVDALDTIGGAASANTSLTITIHGDEVDVTP